MGKFFNYNLQPYNSSNHSIKIYIDQRINIRCTGKSILFVMWTSFTTLIDVEISLTKKYYGQNLENCRYLYYAKRVKDYTVKIIV